MEYDGEMKNSYFLILAILISFEALAQTQTSSFEEAKPERSFFSKIIPNFLRKKSNRTPKKNESHPQPSTTASHLDPVPQVPTSIIIPETDDSMAVTMMPKFYKKRTEAVLNIGLVYYGEYYNMDDLTRVQMLLEERFYKATGEALRLKTVSKAVIPFNSKIENFPDYRQAHVTELERLQRLWYYDNVGMGVGTEVHKILQKDTSEINLEDVDALVVVTGAQFEALGFASGRVAVTENPMEIAWGLEDGGRVELVTDAKVVDELIHEIGHTLFLDHASNQCQKDGMSYAEQEICCASSTAKEDVMSYCRRRDRVNTTYFYGFKDCNRRTIKEKVIPAMLKGDAWAIADREICD